MHRNRILAGILCTSLLAGCGVELPPKPDEIRAHPIVKMGSPAPQAKEYVLYVPKGQPFPLEINLNGYLLNAPVKQQLTMRLNRDLYLYKHWMSYDGKTWKPFYHFIGLAITAGMNTQKGTVDFTIKNPEL